MSGNMQQAAAMSEDPRAQRTRQALLDAFFTLVLSRRYDRIRIADIVTRAGVGRSTFYEHFRSKDELLLESLTFLLSVLADAVRRDCDRARLQFVLEHFWEQRAFAPRILFGAPGRPITRRLAQLIEDRIETDFPARAATAVPIPLIAAQAAECQMAALRTWLTGRVSCTPAALARSLHAGTAALVAASLSTDESA